MPSASRVAYANLLPHGSSPFTPSNFSLYRPENLMEFQDRALECIDCHQSFTFTAGEQEFYERKGFKEIPKRCKPCRESRKQRRGGQAGADMGDEADGNTRPGGGNAQAAGGANHGGGRGTREMFDAVCAACGAPARVPFRPAAGRPVYCRDCYANRSTGIG